MKRNLLNVAMFGLLAAAVPASTFVSCKDYDEDFSQIKATMKSDKQALMDADAAIQKQVTALEGKLATVNETLDNLKKQQGTNTADIKTCVEDIAKLKTAIDTYKKTQDEIRAAVEKLQKDKLDASELVKINASITAAQSAADAAKTDAAAALVEAKKGVKAAADAAQAAKVADGKATSAQTALDAYKAEVKELFATQAQTLANYKKELDKLAADSTSNDASERIEALAAELAKVKATADAAQTQAQVEEAINAAIEKMNKSEKNLNVMVMAAQLKSMEIETAFSYNGIEAIEAAVYELKKLAPANAADANKVNYARAHVDNARSFDNQTPLEDYIPATYAVYNLNPSTAKVKADKANFKFLGLNQILDLRAGTAGFEAPAVESVEVNGGQARVKLNLDKTLSTIKTGVAAVDNPGVFASLRHVSSIALRYSEGDTTVTSSYAALVANTYDGFALYNVNRAGNLKTDFAGRGTDNDLTVSYKDTLDLSKVIATKRKLKNSNELVFWDEKAAQENNPVVAAGFKYQFDIVKDQDNSQTYFYFKLDRNTGRLIPTDGSGNVKKQASVGRKANIRVSLVKGEDIVAVGYFDVTVTGEVIEERVNSMTDNYTLSCDDNAYVLNNQNRIFRGAFDEAAKKIGYSDHQMTNDQYKKFTFVMEGNTIATFTKTSAGAFEKDNTPKFDITLKNNNINSKAFIVKAKQSVADVMKNTGDKIETYVKLTNPQNIEIYLKLTWQPANVYNNPSVDYAADHKPIDNAYIQQDGRREFRVNTGQVHKYDFSYDLTQGFTGNKVDIEFKAPSPYATALGKANIKNDKFVFVEPTTRYVEGGSGARYVVEVGADNVTLNATKVNAQNVKDGNAQEIVTLEGDKIKFVAKQYAQDILNKYSRDEMEDGQTFTAYIKRVADYCKDGKAITVTNNQFAVRFIRPINITAATVEVIADSNQPVQQVPAVINFTDWRNVNFKDEAGLYADADTGYKVSKIEAEAKDKWTTDLDGGTLGSTSLTAKTTKLNLEWVAPNAPIAADNCGKVKYTANNAVTTEFKVRIPLKVTYRWGIIRTHVDVTIKPTVK